MNHPLPPPLREPLRPSVALRIGALLHDNYRRQEINKVEDHMRMKEEQVNARRLKEYEDELRNKLGHQEEEAPPLAEIHPQKLSQKFPLEPRVER